MIESDEMKVTVNRQVGEVVCKVLVFFPRFAIDRLERNCDVAEMRKSGDPIRCWERKHVRRRVLATPSAVQASDFLVVALGAVVIAVSARVLGGACAA